MLDSLLDEFLFVVLLVVEPHYEIDANLFKNRHVVVWGVGAVLVLFVLGT